MEELAQDNPIYSNVKLAVFGASALVFIGISIVTNSWLPVFIGLALDLFTTLFIIELKARKFF